MSIKDELLGPLREYAIGAGIAFVIFGLCLLVGWIIGRFG